MISDYILGIKLGYKEEYQKLTEEIREHDISREALSWIISCNERLLLERFLADLETLYDCALREEGLKGNDND